MKLVINIPEEYYKTLHNIPDAISTADMLLIKYGTPLPEHYGRLIDADALWRKWVFDAIGKQEIDEAPTIIPAEEVDDDDDECIVTDEVVNILCRDCKHHSEDGCYACYYEPATKEKSCEDCTNWNEHYGRITCMDCQNRSLWKSKQTATEESEDKE